MTIRFEIGSRPTSWICHNLPVLTGGALNPFDPVGASRGNAYGVLRGERDETIWAQIYEHAALRRSPFRRVTLPDPLRTHRVGPRAPRGPGRLTSVRRQG